MEPEFDLSAMTAEIVRMKTAAEKLNEMGWNFPALNRNTVRILASIRMLELNISDMVAPDGPCRP